MFKGDLSDRTSLDSLSKQVSKHTHLKP